MYAGLAKFGWECHDGESFGRQELLDGNLDLTTSFVKHFGTGSVGVLPGLMQVECIILETEEPCLGSSPANDLQNGSTAELESLCNQQRLLMSQAEKHRVLNHRLQIRCQSI